MPSSAIVKMVLYLSLVAILAVLTGCASYMHGYTTSRYQKQWLKIDTTQKALLPGNKRLQLERDFDAALDTFILSKGIPDYIYVVDTESVKLAYLAEHKIYAFERPFLDVDSELKRVYGIDEVKGDTAQSKAFLREVGISRKNYTVDGQFTSSTETHPPESWNQDFEDKVNKLSSGKEEPITEKVSESPSKASLEMELGNYHALIIGINDYAHLPKLETAINDARKIEAVLKESYGFETRLLINPGRGQILRALNAYRGRLSPIDNFLIYYAGHGWLDRNADEGYWLPANADEDSNVNWVANSTITATLRAMESKHVLVVSDSCYSGKLSRGIIVKNRTPGYFRKVVKIRSRTVLSSGGLEPVVDSSYGSKHSVFAKYLIQALLENGALTDGMELYFKIKRSVIVNSDQTPEYSDIRKAGHDGGDFIFRRSK